MKVARTVAVFAIAVFTMACAFGQSYPDRPVRVIVPFPVKSDNDVVARAVSQKLSELWGQPVSVENRLGGFGTVGASEVAKSPADGYTLLANTGSLITSGAFTPTLPYDPVRSFVPISALARLPYVVVVGRAAGVRTLAELIAAAKSRPGKLSDGGGDGALAHLLAEQFKLEAGIDVVHVSGEAPNPDVIAGRVTFWFSPLQLALPHLREGTLIALAVTSARRCSLLPEVPTLAEAGLAKFEYGVWSGMWAPAGTPASVVDKIAADIARSLAAPEIRASLAKLDAEPLITTPAEFTRLIQAQATDAARVFKPGASKAP
jgi:tripartite-type tricarboxylate transporter receptor subunit TctC